MSENIKYVWKEDENGHYRVSMVSVDGLEFRSLRQAKVHLKNKRARARRRLNG